jgi:hypothetical protein
MGCKLVYTTAKPSIGSLFLSGKTILSHNTTDLYLNNRSVILLKASFHNLPKTIGLLSQIGLYKKILYS